MKTNEHFSWNWKISRLMATPRRIGRGANLACQFLFLALTVHPIAATSQTSVGTPFPIAINWLTVGGAFDGTNYLAAMESGSHMSSVSGQLISQSGTRVGPLIAIGSVGHACCNAVAFDGTNYLMVWEDDSVATPIGTAIGTTSGFTARGQFISTAGVTLGQPFALTGGDVWLDGMNFLVFGGGKYLFTYRKLFATAAGYSGYVAGRIISPDGTVGSEIRISSDIGDGSSIAFDGTNFLVVWTNGSDVRGRFVSPTGVLGQEVSINASPAGSGPVQVAFGGNNYLVVFHNVVGGNTWDVYGQLVSLAGALVGGVIPISTDPATQVAMGLAFDGTHYMAAWTDMQAGSNWIYGRFISKTGALVGDKVAISTNAGTQMGGIAGFANGKYLAFVNSGVQFGPNGLTVANAAVSGVFVGSYQPPPPDPNQPVAPPPADQTAYTIPTGVLPAAAVAVSATGTLGNVKVTVRLDLSKILSGGSFPGQGAFAAGYNIYVAALVPSGALGLSNAAWFMYPATRAWAGLGSPISAYIEGLAQNATDTVEIDILQGMDVTALVGTEIYIGYGSSDSEMLAAGRYRGVYKLQ